jgi:hypothetical protein
MDTLYTQSKVSDGTSTSEQQQLERSIELLKGLLANIASTEERAAAAKLLAEMEKVGGESKANKVFNILELVTQIVEDMGTRDLAVLARLNKATYDAMKRSPVSRGKLETAQAFFSSPIKRPHDPFVPWAHCGALKLILDSEGSFGEETGDYEVTNWLLYFDFDCNEHDKGSHSEQLLDRLICKPPVYEVEARVSCCVDPETSRNMGQAHKPDLPTAIVTSNTGITVCQLLETRNKLQEEHKLCTNYRNPIPADHDLETGFVRPNVVFSGHMDLDRKDPLVAQHTKQMVEKRRLDVLNVSKEVKFAGYIRAKTEGMFVTLETLAEEQH